MLDENGDCIVTDFVVGRYGYGNVFFPGETNVAGLNLDEIGKCCQQCSTADPAGFCANIVPQVWDKISFSTGIKRCRDL